MKWKFYEPKFEYKKDFHDELLPWTGHIFFAYDLVRNLKPETIVELGTFKGTSLYSFTQAVKDEGLNSNLYGVDTWEGEEHTGEYGDDVYYFVAHKLRTFYPEQNVHMLRMLFDEALKKFDEESIDLLHIDGLHTYEAAKHDYETWKPKVKKDGVILFHDIKVADFGVWEVWQQAKSEYPDALAIEFEHNYGLGALIKNKEVASNISPEMIKLMVKYYKAKANAAAKFRENEDLRNQIIIKDNELRRLTIALKKPLTRIGNKITQIIS